MTAGVHCHAFSQDRVRIVFCTIIQSSRTFVLRDNEIAEPTTPVLHLECEDNRISRCLDDGRNSSASVGVEQAGMLQSNGVRLGGQ